MSLHTFIALHRRRSSFLLYLIVVASSFLVAAVVADIDSTSVFTPNLANVTCYRIPSVVQTKSGVLLAFAEARHGSCGDNEVHEIALRRSQDGGEKWGKVSLRHTEKLLLSSFIGFLASTDLRKKKPSSDLDL